MRSHRFAVWWHRNVRRHRMMDQIWLADIPSPWPEWDDEPVCQVWATRCLVDECFWVSVTASSEHSYAHGDLY